MKQQAHLTTRAAVVALLMTPLLVQSAAAQQHAARWTRPGAAAKPERFRGPQPAPGIVLATVTESEPNTGPASADPIAVGDTVNGVIGVSLDVDYFSIQLVAGEPITLDIDAESLGSLLDPILVVFAQDGTTQLAFNDDADGLDSRIEAFTVATSGTYFVAVTDYAGSGGAAFTYRLRTYATPLGPGDPTTTRATGANAAWTIVAGPVGEAYVLDWADGQIWRMPPTGSPTLHAATDGFDMTLDGFGDLLVTQPDSSNIMRVSTQNGARSRFATIAGFVPVSIAIDAAGDIWVFAVSDTESRLFRFSPYGALEEDFDANTVIVALKMAFSATGVLHLSDGEAAVYRMNENHTFTSVIETDGPGGMTFDTQNSMYLSTVSSGLLKYNSSYALVADPFAVTNLSLSGNTAFLRDASGAMTARLVATNLGPTPPLAGLVVEMNPAGVTAPGIRVGTDLEAFTISIANAAEHLLAGGVLDADEEAYLDSRGNGNGMYDVGDLRAFAGLGGSAAATTISADD